MPDRAKRADRLMAIRLRYTINTHLDDRGPTAPAQIGAAVGLPTTEAVRPPTRRQWREGDVAALQAVAARLGLEVPLEGLPGSPGTCPTESLAQGGAMPRRRTSGPRTWRM